MKTIAVIQARMSSTRLPGKVLFDIAGTPLLEILISRISHAKLLDEIWLATSIKPEDDAIEELCEKLNIPCYRGSLNNVLERYWRVAKLTNADHIVRLTADCPLHDASVIDEIIHSHLKQNADFSGNTHVRTLPDGLDVEVVNKKTLEKVYAQATSNWEKEHVLVHVYENMSAFKCNHVLFSPDTSSQRWTVDYAEDFTFVKSVLNYFPSQETSVSYLKILELIRSTPELLTINNMHCE